MPKPPINQENKIQLIQNFQERSGLKTSRVKFIQLIGDLGSGCRRLAFSFLPAAKTVVWISLRWNLYAPVLWKLAEDQKIQLLGIELQEKKRFRRLCKELRDSQVFDAWILDGLKLSEGEGFFLHQLLRPLSLKVLVLDSKPHSFCHERAHIHLSHQHYRIFWSKGGSPTPSYVPAVFPSEVLCLS